MKLHKLFFTLFLGITIMSSLAAEHAINANIGKKMYAVGDMVTVNIRLDQNSGMHGLFFDLLYDGSVLEFVSLRPGMSEDELLSGNDFYYAVTDPSVSNSTGFHVVVSYALRGQNQLTFTRGELAELRFRVISQGVSAAAYQFSFDNMGVVDGNAELLAGAEWNNSGIFTIGSSAAGAYIRIAEPYANQVIYDDIAKVNAICTAQTGYSVVLANEQNKYQSEKYPAAGGTVTERIVPLAFGYNNITAVLYDAEQNRLAENTVRVYRPEDRNFIKITSPQDHQLLNTDLTEVQVLSKQGNVKVNNLETEYVKDEANGYKLYSTKLWLKPGFNTITAQVQLPAGAVYQDTLVVYYRKHSALFSFLLPQAAAYFKPAPGALLTVKGEIDSAYNNTVTLDVIYTPRDITAKGFTLTGAARIEESGMDYANARTRYVFYNDFDIPLANLKNGELLISAYKNREGLLTRTGLPGLCISIITGSGST